MLNLFYPKMAVANLRKNKSTYFPYMLSCTTIIGLFYMLHFITETVNNSKFEGAGTAGALLGISLWIAGILSAVVIFYTNSFLIKRRKKELGLYSILGMEKRHVGRVLFYEVFITGFISLVCGLIGGILLSRLMFLVLLNLLNLDIALSFASPILSIVITVLLFVGIFLLVMIYNLLQIRLSNPITLLRGGAVGEREPKTKLLMTLAGVICLGCGYFLAMRVNTPTDAITVFFPAVLFVILGTYFLFMAGSIALLKLLRKRKSFYYHPRNFISVSGMIYRMKQNAIGLSNICILSTCVLVVLSSTVCLYIGEEDILRRRYPSQVLTNSIIAEPDDPENAYPIQEGQEQLVANAIARNAKKHNVTVKDVYDYHTLQMPAQRQSNRFVLVPSSYNVANGYDINYIPLDDYNRLSGREVSLAEGEVLLQMNGESFHEKTIELFGEVYAVKEQIDDIQYFGESSAVNTIIVVAPDITFMENLMNKHYTNDGHMRVIYYQYNFDLDGNSESITAFLSSMRQSLLEDVNRVATTDSIYSSRQDFYALYGTLLFIGIFFIILFLMTTVLIIYYKQLSEGYEDRERFTIMQQVGMSKREVKSTIQKQVLMVFFLPLILAVVHIAFAFRVLCKLLIGLNMTNTVLFLCTTGIAILVFALCYLLIYQLTARTYYRLVQREA